MCYKNKDMINSQKPNFDIKLLEDALDFLKSLDEKVRKRVLKDMDKARYELNNSVFKKLGNTGFWEIRTSYMRIEYRFLAFWDATTKSMVVATHGFVKKSMKIPENEYARARNIQAQYYEDKKLI